VAPQWQPNCHTNPDSLRRSSYWADQADVNYPARFHDAVTIKAPFCHYQTRVPFCPVALLVRLKDRGPKWAPTGVEGQRFRAEDVGIRRTKTRREPPAPVVVCCCNSCHPSLLTSLLRLRAKPGSCVGERHERLWIVAARSCFRSARQ
jgi:hypothetical protein